MKHRGRGRLFAIVPVFIGLFILLSGSLISSIAIIGIVLLVIAFTSSKRSNNPYYGNMTPQYNAQYNSYGSSQVPVNYTTDQVSAKPMKTGVYCYECGANLRGSERFCSTCGASQTL